MHGVSMLRNGHSICKLCGKQYKSHTSVRCATSLGVYVCLLAGSGLELGRRFSESLSPVPG